MTDFAAIDFETANEQRKGKTYDQYWVVQPMLKTFPERNKIVLL